MNNGSKFSTTFCTLLLLCGCGADGVSEELATKAKGTFNVFIGDLITFDEQGERARAFRQNSNIWEFRSDGQLLRLSARFPDAQAAFQESSLGLIYNNVFLQFKHNIGGQPISVSCKPAKRPVGDVVRIVQADGSTSGHFKVEFEVCRQRHTDQVIDAIERPLVVRGEFQNI